MVHFAQQVEESQPSPSSFAKGSLSLSREDILLSIEMFASQTMLVKYGDEKILEMSSDGWGELFDKEALKYLGETRTRKTGNFLIYRSVQGANSNAEFCAGLAELGMPVTLGIKILKSQQFDVTDLSSFKGVPFGHLEDVVDAALS